MKNKPSGQLLSPRKQAEYYNEVIDWLIVSSFKVNLYTNVNALKKDHSSKYLRNFLKSKVLLEIKMKILIIGFFVNILTIL